MMAAISDAQGRALASVLERCQPRLAANGTPGFNVGPSAAAAELTGRLRAAGHVEDASSALTLTLEQQRQYLALLPACARHVALESRVAFALTARGKTDDQAGSYGRQFRDAAGKPTVRSKEWYIRLVQAYAAELCGLGPDGALAASKLQALGGALAKADLKAMAGSASCSGNDPLAALMSVCETHMTADVVATIKRHAEQLAPVLFGLDAEVGVTGTKLYDGKLVLSFLARIAVRQLDIPFSDFGLAADGAAIVDEALVRDLIFVLMTLHQPASKRYTPPAGEHGLRVRRALEALASLPALGSTLMLCDTGADPNEDDLCAIFMMINTCLLIDKELTVPSMPPSMPSNQSCVSM